MAERAPLAAGLAEDLLTLLCHDPVNGRLVLGMLEPADFTAEPHRVIAARAIEYWRSQDQPPGAHLGNLVIDELHDAKQEPIYRRLIQNMLVLTHDINAAWVVDQLHLLRRAQELRRSAGEIVTLVDSRPAREAVPAIDELLGKLLRARAHGPGGGIRLTEAARVTAYLEQRASEFMTGIQPLDEAAIVPARGAVMLFIGPPGRGKSWFGINVGRYALQGRKKVLHVSLEMPEEAVLGRYYQALFGLPRYRAKVDITRLRTDPVGRFRGTEKDKAKAEFVLTAPDLPQRIEARLAHWGARVENLLIKHFPPRALTVEALDAYLERLALAERFVPDLLILDYFGLVKTDRRNHRIDLGRQFEDFRGLLSARNLAGVTLQQTSKKGADARNVSITHLAEDFSFASTTDIAITYSATPAERERHLARLFVAKAREEQDQIGVLIAQNYGVGQFATSAIQLDSSYGRQLEEMRQADEREEDEDDAR